MDHNEEIGKRTLAQSMDVIPPLNERLAVFSRQYVSASIATTKDGSLPNVELTVNAIVAWAECIDRLLVAAQKTGKGDIPPLIDLAMSSRAAAGACAALAEAFKHEDADGQAPCGHDLFLAADMINAIHRQLHDILTERALATLLQFTTGKPRPPTAP
jgi:hypothetical protein